MPKCEVILMRALNGIVAKSNFNSLNEFIP